MMITNKTITERESVSKLLFIFLSYIKLIIQIDLVLEYDKIQYV